MSYRLGVDVGGTFTDVLLVEEGSGEHLAGQDRLDPADQAVGVLNGIGQVCAAAGIELAEVAQVLHGTTVATNAILEGKGATVGLVTTKGFRQVLQIARSLRARRAGRLDHLAQARAAGRRWRTPSRSTSGSPATGR